MQRILFLIIFVSMFVLPVGAEELFEDTLKLQGQIEYDDNPIETIYLDENITKPQVNIPARSIAIPIKSLNITSNTNTQKSALARAAVRRKTTNDILPLSGSLVESMGGLTYGTRWGEEISFAQMESSTSFFMRYDASKYFSFDTSFQQSASQDIGTQYGTVRFTPEWHITDHLTIKDSFTDYITMPKTKNEIRFVYTPSLKKYADSLKFELGLAESYFSNGKRSSALSFSTGFRL